MEAHPGKLLERINDPSDLRKLQKEQLPQLCHELREYIIDVVSVNGGHLGASLGVIELSVALHYVFDTPDDKLIWDVGHQAYAHKVLTGRREAFKTNRLFKGISGFPKMKESEYDAFGTGHSSTSISAALGMAMASKLSGQERRQHIAVIGDGSMTAGQAMEALNNAGLSKTNLLVILNDNGIAIDKSVGAISKYLTDITTSKAYNRLKDNIWYLLGGGTRYGAYPRYLVKQLGGAVKSTLLEKSNLFEAFNMRYFGPVGGHDVVRLVELLTDIKKIQGPRMLHLLTTKGKGYDAAEQDQTTFHSPGMFDRRTGIIVKDDCSTKAAKFQHVFGRTLLELAEKNDKIVGITPAMPSGCSLNIMMEAMPDRTFDVGIAEQHAVTFAAGLAAQGYVPFCNIYSSFLQRAYDQVIHDVALQGLHVVMCLDRGGLVGEDGPTHHGVYDLAYLRTIPGITIAAPMDEHELRHMMYTAQLDGVGPTVIRYPRGRGSHHDWKVEMQALEIGKGRLISEGSDIAILSIGAIGAMAKTAVAALSKEGISAAHYDLRFLKPLDTDLIKKILSRFEHIISVEDGSLAGGFGSAIAELMSDTKSNARLIRLGIPDRFIEQGSLPELYRLCGIDAEGIAESLRSILKD